VDKVHNLKKPRNKSELLSALGLLNYVRRALPTQSDPTSTKIGRLYDLTNQRRFDWSATHDEAWKELVEQFNEGLPISCFSLVPGVEQTSAWSLIIQCDASLEYLGFVTMIIPKLPQHLLENPCNIDVTAERDNMRIINIGNKRLSSAERLYVPHDREAMGIFWALEKNRALIYLFGSVILQTDNRTALSRFSKQTADDASTTRGRRWVRWLTDLSDLLPLVKFCHIKGENDSFADYLSRYVLDDFKICEAETQTESASMCLATVGNSTDTSTTDVVSSGRPSVDEFLPLLSKWETDEETLYIKQIKLGDVYRFLSGRELSLTDARRRLVTEVTSRRFSLSPNNCLLFHNNQHPVIVVPKVNMDDGFPLRTKLVKLYHEESALSCHRAELATRSLLRKAFWWPSMDKDVSQWIASCIPCISRKSHNFCGTFNPRKLQAPNQLLICDWFGPVRPSVAGYQFVLVLVDAYSSFAIALPYRYKSSENTADAILHWISLLGCPERWSSDNDSTFVSDTISNLRSMLGIKTELSPSYSPTSQGVVERAISLAANEADGESTIDWPTLLKACIFNANAIERHGGVSPFEIMLGRKPVDPFLSTFGSTDRIFAESYDEYIVKLRQHLQIIHDYWTSKSMEVKNRAADSDCSFFEPLNQGDLCVRVSYISGRRMTHGTVRIISKIGTNTFLAKTATGETLKVHGYQLIKIFDHPDRIENFASTQRMNDVDEGEYFVIEKVIEYDPSKGYLVKWDGYPHSASSWLF
jgi:hypothetical protein